MPGVRKVLTATAALALVVAACGGGDDDAGPADDPQAAETDGAAAAGGGSAAGDGNYAIVTVGDTTYEVPADALNLCNSLDNLIFGSFAIDGNGQATQAGGVDVAIQVNFGLPVPDWQAQGLQAPLLDVDLQEDGVRWWASVDRGLGSVDSWQLEGGRATGDATFVGEETGSGNPAGTESGTFDVLCRSGS